MIWSLKCEGKLMAEGRAPDRPSCTTSFGTQQLVREVS
jgi:hypothetical protein